MTKALRARAAMLVLVATIGCAPAQAGTHAALVRGLAGWLVAPMTALAGRLRAAGADVALYSYSDDAAIVADVCAHPRARNVLVGHSLGALAVVRAAAEAAQRCGAHAEVIAIDPPVNAQAACAPGAINFVGALGGRIACARNVPVPGVSHLAIVDDSRVTAAAVAAVRR